MKSIYEKFADEEHSKLKQAKDALAKKLNKKLTWRTFILQCAADILRGGEPDGDNAPTESPSISNPVCQIENSTDPAKEN